MLEMLSYPVTIFSLSTLVAFFSQLRSNVVFVVCLASLPIAVLGQPGWYTLSALVSQISDSVQVPTLSRIVARVSDGPRLELRSRQGIHSVYVYVLCVCITHGTALSPIWRHNSFWR